MEKKITIKVYNNNENYKGVWNDAEFIGFTKELNGGMGKCSLTLARKFDDYGEYEDVALNNEVQIFISDNDDANKLIYSGYIAEYEPVVDRGEEKVNITLLGYYTKLSQDIYKNGTTTTITESGTDMGVMFRNVIDRYEVETSNPKMYYTSGTVQETITTATYTFEMITYREAINKIKELAPSNWWWYVDEKGLIYFKNKPSTSTHTFIFGRHFSRVKVKKGIMKISNAVLFWNRRTDADQIYKFYTDDASIDDYGRRVERKINQDRVGSSTDADKISNNFIDENKNPHIQVEAEIMDNGNILGYDIESIDPGDTCTFEGFDASLSETFRENMLITKVDYTLNKATLTVEPVRGGVINRQEDINRKVDEIDTAGAPAGYTT